MRKGYGWPRLPHCLHNVMRQQSALIEVDGRFSGRQRNIRIRGQMDNRSCPDIASTSAFRFRRRRAQFRGEGLLRVSTVPLTTGREVIEDTDAFDQLLPNSLSTK